MNNASEKIRSWRENPVRFVRECFGVEPDPWQHDVLMALVKHNRIAMKSNKGSGKTALLSWTVWWFMSVHAHPKVAVTSITGDNLSDGMWSELAKWMNASAFLKHSFQWTKTRIFLKESPETWFASARSWPKSASKEQQADTLAGLHADHIMFVLDEVGGIPDAVMAAAEAALSTGKVCKLIMAGNPTHLEGPLYRACTKEAHLWYVKSITGDPDSKDRSPRVDVNWARQMIQKYGRESAYVRVNVFGEFPLSSINALLGPDDIEAAIERSLEKQDYIHSQKRIGVDVAREGNDLTVLFARQGLASFKPVSLSGADGPTIAGRVIHAKNKWGSELEFIDSTGGYGASAIDFMTTAGYSPIGIHFSKSADDPTFANKRAEMFWRFANWIKKGGSLYDEPRFRQELAAVTYTHDKLGRFLIEPKDLIKDKIGVSPDYTDAAILTFAYPDQPARNTLDYYKQGMGSGESYETEFDPLKNL